jgi:D-alanyl-D-alanine carboxypeptidase/D-alanyl-D-alanine-endopeptidase (penicillin-binding protein 4)
MRRLNLSHKIIVTGIFILVVSYGFAQTASTPIQQKIDDWQTAPGLLNSSTGLAITDTKTGEELFKSVPQLSLVPASIMKVVTTATALEVFGPDFRFITTLSYSGFVRNDTLIGDLQVIGGGDPTLGSKYFPETGKFLDDWTAAVKDLNIKAIKGNIILDATIYESQMIPNTWIWEDIGNYFGAGASGISVFDNLYEIHLSSEPVAERPTKIVKIVPEIPDLELINEVQSSYVNSDQAYVFGSPDENKRIVRGTIPRNKSDFVVKASMPNPSALLASEFMKKLAASNITVLGSPKFEKVNTKDHQSLLLSALQSPSLREIIKVTNHESVNLFAEHLLKHMAFQQYGLGTTKDGCKFVIQFWKNKGLDLNGFFMSDGSGLSRFNALTASQMVEILNYMKTKSAYASDFYQSFAPVGSGTMTVFKSYNFPNQCLRAKSGSMTRVRCYAGYLTTKSGKELSFSVMLNNFSCSQIEAINEVEALLIELRKL